MTRRRLEARFREQVIGAVLKRIRPVVFALAYIWRRILFRTTVIAITGSLGKTTTKENLADVLATAGPTFRNYRNQNAPQAVALNILRIRPWHRYAVLEVAGAAPGMMRKSARLLRPDVAIVLNVLRTHTTEFTDLDQHAAEKQALLASLSPGGIAVVNEDDPFVSQMTVPPGSHVFRFGTATKADCRVDEISASWPRRLAFTLHTPHGSRRIETQLVGTQWITSAAAVMTASLALGLTLDQAAAALLNTPPFAGRLQPMELPNGAVILRDDYNASIDTIDASFSVLAAATATRRILVITDMSDFGRNRKQRLKHIASRAAEVAEGVVFIGESADYGRRRAVEAGIPSDMAHAFPSLQPAAEFLRGELRAGDLVLLKGRTTDHAARIFFGQLGRVSCWKDYCSKRMLCDTCWELGASREDVARATLVTASHVPQPEVTIAP